MGYEFEIDPHAGRARIVAEGEADVGAAIEVLSRLATSDDFRPGLRLLVDLRRLSTARRADEVDEIAAFVGRNLHFARIAILAESEEKVAVLHRARETLEGEVPVGVFTDSTEARSWLDQRGPVASRA